MKEGKIEVAKNLGFMMEARRKELEREKEERRLGEESTLTSTPVGEGDHL